MLYQLDNLPYKLTLNLLKLHVGNTHITLQLWTEFECECNIKIVSRQIETEESR